VSLVTGSSNATVTTSAPHGLASGGMVTISGTASGNGVYQITSVSGSTFQIGLGGLPANSSLTDATLQGTAYAGPSDNGTTTTTFSGTNSNYLLLQDTVFFTGTNLNDPTLPTDYITVGVKGWCSGTCAGEDTKIQACLTINGVNCWPTNASAKYQE